jgi:hypothetical protein
MQDIVKICAAKFLSHFFYSDVVQVKTIHLFDFMFADPTSP